MKASIIRQGGRMKQKVIALLQARTDSTRLPGKVLLNILNKPMIIHQLHRTSKSKYIDELIVVTSDEKSDDDLTKTIFDYGVKVFRGDKKNVLKRFYDCANFLSLSDNDIIVRLTGDCPLHDADIIDESISKFIDSNCDYLANCVEPIYPDGLDVEVFSYRALKTAYQNATKISDLEHVTPYIRNSDDFKVEALAKAIMHPEWRLTVDEQSDFSLITKIYEYFNSTYFSFEQIVDYLESNQYLLDENMQIKRNEGYVKSLKEDNDN